MAVPVNALEPLWKIEDELAALLDSLDTCPEELRPELEQRITAYLGAEVEKVDRIGAVFASLESVQAAAKLEIDRLRQRHQSAQKAAERLEQYVLHILQQREGKPLKGRNVTFSVGHSESLIITDPQLVPDLWKRTTVTVDIPKDPLKKAIKGGEHVPGARLQTNEHLIKK
jgi:hypothetical protein